MSSFVFTVVGMEEKTIGWFFEVIREIFFESEKKGLCKYFLYILGNIKKFGRQNLVYYNLYKLRNDRYWCPV